MTYLRLFSVLLAVPLLLSLGCQSNSDTGKTSVQLKVSLNEAVKRYTGYLTSEDFVGAAAFILPEVAKEMGGVARVVQFFKNTYDSYPTKSFIIHLADLQVTKTSPIVKVKNKLGAVIHTKTPVVYKALAAEVFSSMIAISTDDGESWYFLEGTDEGRILLTELHIDLMQKLQPPTPYMKLGEDTLYQQNGSWARKTPKDTFGGWKKVTP